MGEVVSIDTAAREICVRTHPEDPPYSLPYDHLVLALGSVTRMPPVPGLAEHGFQMKGLADAVGLRDRAIQMLERADATDDEAARAAFLGLVVVGANFTGAEVAGEFDVFWKQASRSYRNVSPQDCRIALVERADRILGALDPALSDYAAERLRARGIRIRLGRTVREIRRDEVELDDGERIPTRTVIWCAGIAPPPLLVSTGLPLDPLGYLRCEPDLRVVGEERIWGIGDCAVNPDPAGRSYPATAQHAVRQGQDLAANLLSVVRGQATRPHVYHAVGAVAALGCRTGVARVFGIRLSGFKAWVLWRTVYLFKMPGWRRRIRVALDWTLDLLFPREHVQLGLRDRPRPAGQPPSVAEANAVGKDAGQRQ
jgi:NADH dehydrogenase